MLRLRTSRSILLLLASAAGAQRPTQVTPHTPVWNLSGLVTVEGRVEGLDYVDQQGILRATKQKAEAIRVARIRTTAGHMYIVQGRGSLCNTVGDCASWVLGNKYQLLMTVSAEMFRLQPPATGTVPEIVTSTHSSATAGDLKRWRFNGQTYRRIACASFTLPTEKSKRPQPPQIISKPCRG